MTFEQFFAGKPMHYMGSDSLEYVATVKRTGEVRRTIITRADGRHIECKGVSRRCSYNLPVGQFAARMQYDEALRYPVPTQRAAA